jgi:ankyrin repeat protein
MSKKNAHLVAQLMDAAQKGDVRALRALLNRGAPLDGRDPAGLSALHVAAMNDRTDAIRALLEAGADVNARTEIGSTPLMAAARSGAVAAVNELIAAGADVMIANRRGQIAFDFANATEKRGQLKKLLRAAETAQRQSRRRAGPTPGQILIEAAGAGDVARLRACLKDGVPVDTAANNGETPLTRAAAFGQAEAVTVLLEAGADPNRRGADGATALNAAAFTESAEVVRLLLEHGADVNADDEDGCTPLMGAALEGQLEIARLLLQAGADPTRRGTFALHRNKTALEMARTIENRSRRKAMMDLLTPGAPATEGPEEDLATAAVAPAFRKLLDLLEGLGAVPKPWKKCPGVFRCARPTAARLQQHFAGKNGLRETLKTVPARQRAGLLLEHLRDQVRTAGGQLVTAGIDTTSLLLFPTTDKYAVLRAHGTDGINHGHTTEDVIAWLREMEKKNPFVLTACSHAYVAGKFTGPPRGAGALAERLCAFCPDLIDGDVIDSPAQVAGELERTHEFGLWWD